MDLMAMAYQREGGAKADATLIATLLTSAQQCIQQTITPPLMLAGGWAPGNTGTD